MLKQFIRKGYIGREVFDYDGTCFVQESRGAPIGVMVGVINPETKKISMGWSLISKNEDLSEIIPEKKIITTPKGKKTVEVKKPVWTAKRIWEYGTRLAEERALGKQPQPQIIPSSIREDLILFEDRCHRYFKM